MSTRRQVATLLVYLSDLPEVCDDRRFFLRFVMAVPPSCKWRRACVPRAIARTSPGGRARAARRRFGISEAPPSRSSPTRRRHRCACGRGKARRRSPRVRPVGRARRLRAVVVMEAFDPCLLASLLPCFAPPPQCSCVRARRRASSRDAYHVVLKAPDRYFAPRCRL